MLPNTEATPAFPISLLVRLMFSRMMGMRGAAANVETKQVKKEIQERWNVLLWGLTKEKSSNTLALWSESTGRSNPAVLSVGTIGGCYRECKALLLAGDVHGASGRALNLGHPIQNRSTKEKMLKKTEMYILGPEVSILKLAHEPCNICYAGLHMRVPLVQ
ncbi:hypothetical protein CRG98_015053 [Punica granatum]|uniref:Uncharacterized protein n=1 Tax=Punica granatum TaxID=22663 RepID=A0A2I0K7U2_PUNGR|nr:hypothetical protein CRG98_015053 [Punica granatum]